MKNEFIKNPGIKDEYTLEQTIELKKCELSPIYFMKKYMKVLHPTKGSVPFNLYPYQEKAVNTFLNNKDTLVLCGRQMGKCVIGSTLITVTKKPSGIKKLLLKLLFKDQYKGIFKNEA